MAEIKFDAQASTIVVDVEIKGISLGHVKMVLDTGASFIMVPWRILDILGLKIGSDAKWIYVTTASGVEKVPLIELEAVTALGKTSSNVKAIVHDLPQKSYVDGLLGLSFLRNFDLHVNFKEGVLDLE